MSDPVLVAIIGVVGAILVEIVRRGFKSLSERVGTPNGQGNIVQMLERILRGQTGQDLRLAKLEEGQANHAQRLHLIEQHMRPDEAA